MGSFLGESSGTDGIPEEAMEPLIPVSKAMAPEEETLAREQDMVPSVEIEVSVSKESVAPQTDSLFPKERRSWDFGFSSRGKCSSWDWELGSRGVWILNWNWGLEGNSCPHRCRGWAVVPTSDFPWRRLFILACYRTRKPSTETGDSLFFFFLNLTIGFNRVSNAFVALYTPYFSSRRVQSFRGCNKDEALLVTTLASEDMTTLLVPEADISVFDGLISRPLELMPTGFTLFLSWRGSARDVDHIVESYSCDRDFK